MAVVIRSTDPNLIQSNDGLGQERLDTNPRRLLVFERVKGGFRQIASADHLVPPAGSMDTPCLVDPLDDGGIAVSRGVLSVDLRYWTSCGGWGSSTNSYKFRLQGGRFRLIGFDHIEFMRNTGEGEKISVNFLTLRMKRNPWSIESSVDGPARWSRIRPQRYYLDTLDISECPEIDDTTAMC